MENSNLSNEDRQAIITKFVLLYVICILCFLVPMYYLFNIPDKIINKLNVTEYSAKNQQKKLDRYKLIWGELDAYIAEDKISMEYHNSLNKLYALAKDSIDEKNLYKPLYLKISYLYENIEKENALGYGKTKFDELKKEYEQLKTDYQKLESELDNCKQQNILMIMNK